MKTTTDLFIDETLKATTEVSDISEIIEEISSDIKENNFVKIKKLIKDQHYNIEELSNIMTHLEKNEWGIFFRLLPINTALEVFGYLEPYMAHELIDSLKDEHLRIIIKKMPPDDRTAIFEELPGILTRKLLKLLSKQEFSEAQTLLGYPEESIGRMMTTDYVAVNENRNVKGTIQYIRKNSLKKELISLIYVLNKKKQLVGYLTLRKLMASEDEEVISKIMDKNVFSLSAQEDREGAIQHFHTYDVPGLPVTDSNQVLLGIITFDDIMDVAEEETTEDIHMSQGILPLHLKYLHNSILNLFTKRVGWLLFLFATAFVSSTIISHFNNLITLNIALTYFIPVLIGAGGNTGGQSATLVIRALATDELSLNQWTKALSKEFFVGILLGLTLGIFIYLFCFLYTSDATLSVVVGLSMLFLVLWANVIGSMLPIIITKLKFDPAVVSSPFITTLVDALGLLIYFIIASILLN